MNIRELKTILKENKIHFHTYWGWLVVSGFNAT